MSKQVHCWIKENTNMYLSITDTCFTLKRLRLVLGILLCVSVSTSVHANNLYRYKGANDEVVIDDRIPPEFISKGYEVLNSSGFVIETVEPELTAEQRAKKSEQERLQEKQKEQREKDKWLLDRFSDASDAVRARDRQLTTLDTIIIIAEGNIKKLKRDEEKELAFAASAERAGREVPEDVMENIERIREQIEAAEKQIEEKKQEQEAIREKYQVMIDRLKEIEWMRKQSGS